MRSWVPILSYHRIADVPKADDPLGLCTSRERFDRTLRYLRERGYEFVYLDVAVQALESGVPRGKRYVCLTFDDAYHDFYTDAFPLMRRYGAKGTVFVVTGCIGRTNLWDRGYQVRPTRLLSRAEIRELDALGVEFGSHGVSHRRLTDLDDRSRVRELVASKDALEVLLGHPVRFFCYPHGGHDAQIRAAVRLAGYLGAVGGEQPEHEPYLMHRVDVAQASWPATLVRLWGWRHALQRSAALRGLKRSMLPKRRRPVEVMEANR